VLGVAAEQDYLAGAGLTCDWTTKQVLGIGALG